MDQLDRFIKAQKTIYHTAFQELKDGKKRSHWMWFIFPQISGLGHSDTAMFYGIKSKQEAESYYRHPILGVRLIQITKILLDLPIDDPTEVFGTPDDLKLKSCMTLFAALPDIDPIFQNVLNKFFKGHKDNKTLRIINVI